MPNIFAITQAAYRWYDDGTESGAIARAAQDTAPTVNVFAGNQDLHLRIRFDETGAGSISGATTDDYQVQVSKNGAAFANVNGASANVIGFDSASLTDGGATTQRLTAGGGSFVAGKIAEDGLLDNHQITANNHTEYLYTVRLVSADLADGDALTFRVLKNGATTNVTYAVTPTLNVAKVAPVTREPAVGSLALVGALVALAFSGPATGELAFTGYAPTVSVSGDPNTTITVPAGSLVFTGSAPSVVVAYRITPPTGSIEFSGSAPAVAVSDHRTAAPAVGSLVFAGQAPGVTIDIRPLVPVGTLRFTGYAPTVTETSPGLITAPVGALRFTGQAPSLTSGIGVPIGALAFAGEAPTVTVERAVSPPTGSLQFTGYAPSVAVAVRRAPGVGALVFTGYAPSVSTSGPSSIVPLVGALRFTGLAPTVSVVNPNPPPYTRPRGQRETRVHVLFGRLDTTEGHMRRRT